MNKIVKFSVCTLLAIGYGAVVHENRSDVASYHSVRKPTTCVLGEDEYDIVEYHFNPHRHPNHCWNYMGSNYPNLDNTSFPERTGKKTADQSPFSTATSLLYLVVALLTNDDGGTVLLSLLAASSFELHREPTDVSRHNDWGIISPLLVWYSLAGIETAYKYVNSRDVSVLVVSIMFWTTYQDIVVAISVGAGLISVRSVYIFWTDPSLRWTLGMSVLCAGVAFTAKQYGDGNLGWIRDHHHIGECTNNRNSGRIEDIVHSQWHVFSALALLLFERRVDVAKTASTVRNVIIVLGSVAVVASAFLNNDNYGGWLSVCIVSPVLWLMSELIYNETTSKTYTVIDPYFKFIS